MAAEMQQLVDMGFAEADVRRVFAQVGGNVEQAVERLLNNPGGLDDPTVQLAIPTREVGETDLVLRGQNSVTEAHTAPREPDTAPPRHLLEAGAKILDANKIGSEDQDLTAALEMSMREQQAILGHVDKEPEILPKGALAAEACGHERELPCGLRNIGNTCYVNSFLQTLMHIDELRERILRFRSPVEQVPLQGLPEPELEPAQSGGREAANASRREHCIRLAAELRHLFAHGLFTMRSCIDPTRLLNELVDEKGQKLPIGSQEDVGEFMLKFLERLEEGLRAGSFIDGEEPSPTDEEKTAISDVQALQDTTGAPDKTEKPSPVQSLFFGQQVQIFSYSENASSSTADKPKLELAQPEADGASSQATGGLVVSEEKGEFLQIFLDVKHKDLYAAWEAASSTQVEYTTPSGSSTEANTNLWIERLPKLLSFQLQRVVFDSEKKVQVKLDEPFEFDLTIHVDRFLLANRQAAQEAAGKVRELRDRTEELSKALSGFQEYKGRPGLGITELLALAAECVQENAQASSTPTDTSCPRLELCSPENVAAAGLPQVASVISDLQSAAPSAVHILRCLRESCLAQEAMLKSEIDRLNAEIGEAHQDLRKHPYELHAIWVHQGIAGSGHYWAYVRDWQSNRWIRYDDAQVSLVTWEEVRTASVGQAGSNTSAYVLFYVDKALALEQSRPRERAAALKSAEAVLTQQLISDIHQDNIRLKEEMDQAEERQVDQELRQHAEAIFQDYAGLLYKWEPLKKTGDRNGNPHDPNMRKFLHDPALLNFQLFLYRLHGEQEVWTYLLSQSIDSQRQVRKWTSEEDGRVLYFLSHTLKSQKCYASMLVEITPFSQRARCELQPIDLVKRQAQYKIVLLQAHIIDEALQALKDDGTQLVNTVGRLAFVWARWNLEAEDKFRQNEVLLIMSTLIYNTINFLHRHRDQRTLSEAQLAMFQPTCEYFLLLLFAVEWPNTWKGPLITRIQTLFPQLSQGKAASSRELVQKDAILQHNLTQARDKLENYEASCPEAGQDFFDRHRLLYSWLMQSDEVVSREYVVSLAPSLQQIPVGSPPP